MGGKWRPFGAIVGLMILVGGTAAAPATSGTGLAVGTLNLSADVRFVSTPGSCPPGATAGVCAARRGGGLVRGLGNVTETYVLLADVSGPPSCAAGLAKALAYPVQFAVAGKGEIRLVLAEGAQCVDLSAALAQTQAFTVTGGTGIYAGASGSGTVVRVLGAVTTTGRRMGRETWTGTLAVPGLEFDLTPPTLSGAIGKTVRAPREAKSVRVTFKVTARDDADGSLPVTCAPRSGSRFKLGKSRVTCAATDASGNTATARFTITVKARK